ncbi:MAG TPA: bifunctional serine/threonine-protein kinase/formylglycine-generating enzyme family protein [Gemmataceae bacterium]|nr:bifunctional serine/threonine-protein kinase/formylglycine-generating enzyme family protein [Gemmataceae bacterium]
MPLEMPTTIARYQVRELLGSGAFGAVYRAFDPQLERDVALKVLRPELTASTLAVERFLREAKAAARLRHPHIVPVHDAGRAGDVHYIASAFIRGRTLASAVRPGGVDPRQAAVWTMQLASALGYAQQQGVLHRDVKPANAMLDESGALQLMDFGLAAWTQDESTRLTQEGTVMGTPAYMSPEQADGDTANVGPASDVYSAGVVLYQLLTGRLPFEAPRTAGLVYQIVHTAPPPPSARRPGLDPALETICLKAIAKRPAERFATGEEMAAALRSWLAGVPAEKSSAEWEKETSADLSPRSDAMTASLAAGPTTDGRSPRHGIPPLSWFGLAGAAAILILGAAYLLLRLRPSPTAAAPARPAEPPRAAAPFDAEEAKRLQQAWADSLGLPVERAVDLGGGVQLNLRLIPPGSFTMGSPEGENGRFPNEGPQHPVEITRPFYLGLTPVTKGQFAAFAQEDGYQTEAEKRGEVGTWRKPTELFIPFVQVDDDPVVCVNWNDAMQFCRWLSKKGGAACGLPTEAEWEYACRAGTTTAYFFGADVKQLGDYQWFHGNNTATHPLLVGRKRPNVWGLYDMGGNVCQLCADYYGDYKEGLCRDPRGADSGDGYVLRSGSWANDAPYCRSAFRDHTDADSRWGHLGFRVAVRIAARASQ